MKIFYRIFHCTKAKKWILDVQYVACDLLFDSGPNCSLPSALDYIGLSDIMTLVKFMCLCATGKVLYPLNCQPRDSAESLGHLTTAIGTLVQDSPASLRQLIQLCTQVSVRWSHSLVGNCQEKYSCAKILVCRQKVFHPTIC